MSCRNYHLRASATVTTNAAASVQIVRKGKIKSCALQLYNATATAACIVLWELSLVPTFQSNTNDAQGIIANGSVSSEVGVLESMPIIIPSDCDVNVGERVYLHVLFISGNETEVGIANVAVAES